MAKSGKTHSPGRDSRTGAFVEAKPSGKGSRLVRYPTTSNALRALLKDADDRTTPVTVRSSAGRFITTSARPSPSERSKPSPQALRLVKELGAGAGSSPAAGSSSDRSLPRITPAAIAESADLGDMVRIRRHMLKLSQKDLAEKAGVGRRFVGELEAGKPTAELGKILAACRALGLSLTVQVSDGG